MDTNCRIKKHISLFLVFFSFFNSHSQEIKLNSFEDLISLDSISKGSFSYHLENLLTTPYYKYFNFVTNVDIVINELKNINELKWVVDILKENKCDFYFKVNSKKQLEIYFKNRFFTVIDPPWNCENFSNNTKVINGVRFFRKNGLYVENLQLKKKFILDLRIIQEKYLKQHNLQILKIQDVFNNEVNVVLLMQYDNIFGLSIICDNQFCIEYAFFKDIELLCSSYCNKRKYSRIIFDTFVF